MNDEKKETTQGAECCKHKHHGGGHGVSGGVYGLAFIGALVYFLQNTTSFWDGVLGVFKALFWPGFLIYKLLGFLHM
jgi:hypothetical protein